MEKVELEFEVTLQTPVTVEALKAVKEKICAACDNSQVTRIKFKWTEPQNLKQLFAADNIKNSD